MGGDESRRGDTTKVPVRRRHRCRVWCAIDDEENGVVGQEGRKSSVDDCSGAWSSELPT